MIDDPGVRLRVVRCQDSQVWQILTHFVDYYSPFWGPEAISIVVEPQVTLTCRSSALIGFSDSGPFMGYYSPFCGHEAISIVVEPQGALMCWSSTLIVLANYGRFVDYY